MKFILIIAAYFISSICIAQTSPNKKTWKDVELREFTSRGSFSANLIPEGESILRNIKVSSLGQLSEQQIQKMKKIAAKNNCYLIYVDTKNFYTIINGVYFLWLKSK
jgi:hypothetical protein